nr:ribosome biogenesis protein enp2 [Quercus suber]
MKLSNPSAVPVYTIAGASTARPLPEWLARKRKRSLKKDAEYANRVELLQDFEFDEASQCVRVSEDGEWVMSTDRFLEFHNPGGLHYSTRIPRYGRDLKYNRRTAEALVPSVGVNTNGNGEVFRLNLELGRFLKGFEVDVGGDDFESLGGGALQGGIRTGAVNCAAVAEESHGLLAFGTSIGTVELWDARSRNRVSLMGPPSVLAASEFEGNAEITALEFHRSGLNLATGSSTGFIHTYDLRSPVPLLRKDQGYGFSIQTLKYLDSTRSSPSTSDDLILSADKRAIKIWNSESGDHWTSVEPAVDINHVEVVPDSGMVLTANEGRQQHSFFIPQLGPAPKWCAFLDNLVEEMAEDADDPSAFNSTGGSAGEVYDNYKFLDMKQLRDINLDHLIGQTNLLRPYMHGYFVAQKLYEQARLLSNPDLAAEQRQKSIQEKINKERESRIRGNKKVTVKVNRKLAEKLVAREEANERRKAQRVLRQGGDEPQKAIDAQGEDVQKPARDLLDSRFQNAFEDEDFEIDENSREFALLNPSTKPTADVRRRGLTAVEEDEMASRRGSSSEEPSDEEDDDDEDAQAEAIALRARQRTKVRDAEDNNKKRIGSANYKKSGHTNKYSESRAPNMRTWASNQRDLKQERTRQNRTFGDRAAALPAKERSSNNGTGLVVGAKEVTFAPAKKAPHGKSGIGESRNAGGNGKANGRDKERRSASGNVFRKM